MQNVTSRLIVSTRSLDVNACNFVEWVDGVWPTATHRPHHHGLVTSYRGRRSWEGIFRQLHAPQPKEITNVSTVCPTFERQTQMLRGFPSCLVASRKEVIVPMTSRKHPSVAGTHSGGQQDSSMPVLSEDVVYKRYLTLYNQRVRFPTVSTAYGRLTVLAEAR